VGLAHTMAKLAALLSGEVVDAIQEDEYENLIKLFQLMARLN
jgi:hypothetical protein